MKFFAQPTRLPVDPAVNTARWSLIILFGLLGLSYSSWLARVPALRELLGLSTTQLGVVFLAGAAGSLIFVALAAPLVLRFGGRSVLTVSALGIGLAYFLGGLGPTIGNVWVLATGLFLNGAFVALTNVPQNVETAAVERRIGRPILPHFHAAYSIGAVTGSLFGALCAYLGVPIIFQFTFIGVATVILRFALIPKIILDTALDEDAMFARINASRRKRITRIEMRAGLIPKLQPLGLGAKLRSRRTSLGSALGAWREPRTLMIGSIIFAAALSEGSANNWLSIAVVDGFGKTESAGAVMFAVFLTSMTIVRLAGPQLITRFGRIKSMRYSASTSILGLLLFGFAPSFELSVVGIALWGMGAALTMPLGISAASDDPLKAAARVSVVVAHASIATLAAPPILGFLAQAIGARAALATISVFLVLSLLASKALGRVSAGPYATEQHGSTPARLAAPCNPPKSSSSTEAAESLMEHT